MSTVRTVSDPTPSGLPRNIINRELSWLDFNERVLRMATEPGIALLERVKFCSIFSSNLDEFFQVRVAAMTDQEAAGITALLPDGISPARQLKMALERVRELCARQNPRVSLERSDGRGTIRL